MNLLQLANRLIDEAGITAGHLTTTAGQTGELARVVQWVQSAWLSIQMAQPNWRWMRKQASIVTVAGQAGGYDAPDADVATWCLDTARNYVTASGNVTEIFMDFIEYDDFRDSYLYGALRTAQSRPLVFTIEPTNMLAFGPVPNGDHTVTSDYFSRASELADDAAIPLMPERFHMAIVWRALMLYGGYEAASEAYARGQNELTVIQSMLEIDQLPMIRMGGPLA